MAHEDTGRAAVRNHVGGPVIAETDGWLLAFGLVAVVAGGLTLLLHHSPGKMRARAVLADAEATIQAEYARFRQFVVE